jgi:hypothetical protein
MKLTEWLPLDTVIEKIKKIKPDNWYKFPSIKYIELRIDTRDLTCLIRNRKGKEIDIKELINFTHSKEILNER